MKALDDIAARHAASTPGTWELDYIKGEDGNGTFTAYAVLGPDGKSLLDTGNSESIELHTEYDEDEFGTHVSVWDEIGRRNIEFIAHAHQDIPALLADNARLRRVLQRVIDNDLTEYDHHQKRRDGKKPMEAEEPGSIWLTPRQMATDALKESI